MIKDKYKFSSFDDKNFITRYGKHISLTYACSRQRLHELFSFSSSFFPLFDERKLSTIFQSSFIKILTKTRYTFFRLFDEHT